MKQQNHTFRHAQQERRKWYIVVLWLCLLSVGVGGCGGNDNDSPSATSSFIRVSAEETTIAVDVSPIQVGIATTKLTFHGFDDVHEYHVMYARTDGSAEVPTPFAVRSSPALPV